MNTRIIPNKAFSDWYDSLPDGEPSYQQTFEAGQAAALKAQPDDDFNKWLSRSYREPHICFTKWNMEVAYKAGQAAALKAQQADVERYKSELNAYDKALRCEGWPLEARIDRARMLAEVNTQKPSAYIAFSENGEHISYWTRSLEDAQTWTGRTNKKCEPFYPAPVQPVQEPVAWSVTYNGQHCGNLFGDSFSAKTKCMALNEQWPNDKRVVVPLYAAPMPPTCKDSLTVAPAQRCTCLGSQLGPHYCEVHAA